jgi:hypothetical protein
VLAVDWVPSRPERAEGLIIVYDGGILPPEEIERIVLADGELARAPRRGCPAGHAAANPPGRGLPGRDSVGHGRRAGERQPSPAA